MYLSLKSFVFLFPNSGWMVWPFIITVVCGKLLIFSLCLLFTCTVWVYKLCLISWWLFILVNLRCLFVLSVQKLLRFFYSEKHLLKNSKFYLIISWVTNYSIILAQNFSKFGNLSTREFWLWHSSHVTVRTYVRQSVRTDSAGGGWESQDNPTGGKECHLFLAGNCAVLLGNRHFSWQEIAWPPSLLKKRFL